MLAFSGHAVNLFSCWRWCWYWASALTTRCFQQPARYAADIAAGGHPAMMTTLLTLGMLVFSATQAISSFGIVLVSGIFAAFLLSPLAMPTKKRKDDEKTIILARLRATRRLIAGRLQPFAAGAARPPAGVAGTGYARHVAAAGISPDISSQQLLTGSFNGQTQSLLVMLNADDKSSRWRVCHLSVSACSGDL